MIKSMDKKTWILIAIAVVLVVFVGGTAIYLFKPKSKTDFVSPKPKSTPTEVVTSESEMLEWEDPAGFKFAYSKGIEINTHKEDKENYAHLELTASGKDGKIIIWVKDTTYKTINDWAKKEAVSGQVFDSQLADKPAKKVTYSVPQKVVLATIDVDALVLIEMTPDPDGFWQTAFEEVISSFTFTPLPGESKTTPSTNQKNQGSGVIEEPEEVIQ